MNNFIHFKGFESLPLNPPIGYEPKVIWTEMEDNLNELEHTHNPITLGEDNNALRWLCTECKENGIIRKDWRGVPLNREYAKVFRREILQPNSNLFYKYYSTYLRK